VNVHGTGLTNFTSPGQPGQAGDNIRCDACFAAAMAFSTARALVLDARRA
jgi:hypothetical protein